MQFTKKHVGGAILTSGTISPLKTGSMGDVIVTTVPRHYIAWVVLIPHDVCWYSGPTQ